MASQTSSRGVNKNDTFGDDLQHVVTKKRPADGETQRGLRPQITDRFLANVVHSVTDFGLRASTGNGLNAVKYNDCRWAGGTVENAVASSTSS